MKKFGPRNLSEDQIAIFCEIEKCLKSTNYLESNNIDMAVWTLVVLQKEYQAKKTSEFNVA